MPENTDNVQILTACLVELFYQCWCSSAFFPSNLSSSGMQTCSLPMKNKKKWAHNKFEAAATHTSLVNASSQIHTDYWAWNGSNQSCFCNLKTAILNKQDEKSNQNCCVYILYSMPIDKPPPYPDFFSSLPLCSITLFMYSGTVVGNLSVRRL